MLEPGHAQRASVELAAAPEGGLVGDALPVEGPDAPELERARHVQVPGRHAPAA